MLLPRWGGMASSYDIRIQYVFWTPLSSNGSDKLIDEYFTAKTRPYNWEDKAGVSAANGTTSHVPPAGLPSHVASYGCSKCKYNVQMCVCFYFVKSTGMWENYIGKETVFRMALSNSQWWVLKNVYFFLPSFTSCLIYICMCILYCLLKLLPLYICRYCNNSAGDER